MSINRRRFVKAMAATMAVSSLNSLGAQPQAVTPFTFGICATADKAPALKNAGFSFIEGQVAKMLCPEMSHADYASELVLLKKCVLPIRACNGFIPGKFKLTGPKTEHEAALSYALTACQRADELGMSYIVLGSGPARTVPEGFDHAQGLAQFLEFCKKLADRIENCQVTIVLEPLYKKGSNIFNTVAEGIDYVDQINHPRIQLLADFFHMAYENEGPESIRKAGARIRHCHIAELDGQTPPGAKGQDFSGFFRALRDIDYKGGVSCECRWPNENLIEVWRKAVVTMQAQAGV